MKEKLLQSLKDIQTSKKLYDTLMIGGHISMTTYKDLVEELNRAEEARFKLLVDFEKQSA